MDPDHCNCKVIQIGTLSLRIYTTGIVLCSVQFNLIRLISIERWWLFILDIWKWVLCSRRKYQDTFKKKWKVWEKKYFNNATKNKKKIKNKNGIDTCKHRNSNICMVQLLWYNDTEIRKKYENVFIKTLNVKFTERETIGKLNIWQFMTRNVVKFGCVCVNHH